MTPEHWQEIKQILAVVLEVPPPQRTAILDDACADKPDLRREVEHYLNLNDHPANTPGTTASESHREGTSGHRDVRIYFAKQEGDSQKPPAPVPGLIFSLDSVKPSDEIVDGARLGPYRIDKLLGRGGMGSVHLATREDDYRKKVALKVIKRGMDTDEIVQRFRHERQILARLEHPHVARLLDGGSTPDGRPFFVMEYIAGEPIDAYCDEHKLPVYQRLLLFLKVCSAVQFAHQNLVVHRDLKPGNILIDRTGEPKLLDFGIAKLLRSEANLDTVRTAPDRRPMTPRFASPEQLRGGAITTASDTYSLGVLLYQLLTGYFPYQTESDDETEIAQKICEEDPKRPSTIVTSRRDSRRSASGETIEITPESVSAARDSEPRKLRQLLSGDLDAIVLKAMAKEPRQRYGSVEQLADDVRRHLAALPVTARQSTWTYRSGRFIKRNKIALATASGFAVLLLSYGISATLLWQRAEQESEQALRAKSRAEVAEGRAQTTTNFLIDLFRASEPDQAKGEDVTARQLLDQGRESLQDLRQQPEDYIATSVTLGRSYRLLGDYTIAKELLSDALLFANQKLGSDHYLSTLSQLHLATLLSDMDEKELAEPMMRQAVEQLRQHLPTGHPDLTRALNLLGELLLKTGDLDEAQALFQEVLAMRRKGVGDDDPELFNSMNNLANLLFDKGQIERADNLNREALAGLRREPEKNLRFLGGCLNVHGKILHVQGHYAEAEGAFREDLEIRQRLYGEQHHKVASSLNNLAKALQALGKLAEAEKTYRRSLAIYTETLGDDHSYTAVAMANLAVLLAERKHWEECADLASQALAVLELSPEKHRGHIADLNATLTLCHRL